MTHSKLAALARADLDEMRTRAMGWVYDAGTGATVTREDAINEEHLALDVLALIAENERMAATIRAFVDTIEHAESCMARERGGGQHVSYHGDFAGAGPSVMSRLRWWVREFKAALDEKGGA